MIYLATFLVMLLLVGVNLIAYRSPSWKGKVGWLCLLFLIGPAFINKFLPSLALMAGLVSLGLIDWKPSPRGAPYFRRFSVAAAAIALVMTGLMVYKAGRGYDRLRARYPFESMETRLPTPKPSSRERPLPPATLDRLTELERKLWSGQIRSLRLKRLHEDVVELFVNSAGFGIARMSPDPSEANLAGEWDERRAPRQPGPRIAWAGSPGEWSPLADVDETQLGFLHEAGVLDFANSWYFGYIKDRRNVVGFEPHRFGGVPWSSVHWKLQTLDLVGLLLDDEPRVYISEHLPNMGEARTVPTRPPDRFEAIGLNSLREGDDLWIAREGETARMLGAIRSVEQCIACHGGERGDLLGAFTYTLRLDESSPASE